MPVEPESELDWNAFLYVSGEMTEAEILDFERILLEDQAAREAVASAVELIQVVGSVEAEVGKILSLPSRNRGWVRLAWAVAAALVGAALITGFRSVGLSRPDDNEVAAAWSGIRQGADADWKAVVSGLPSLESNDPTLGLETDPDVEHSTERPLPSWLLSAASVSRDETPQEKN